MKELSKNILFPIGAFYPSTFGGPPNTVYWHTVALKENGFSPTIITTTVGINSRDMIFNKYLEMNCGRVYYGSGNSFNLRTIIQTLKNVKRNNVIHLSSIFDFLSIVVFAYVKLFNLNKKIVWSARGELNPRALRFSTWKKRPFLGIYKAFSKGILFHSTSEQESRDIKSIFPCNKIVEVNNLMFPAKREVGLEVKKQFLFVGRIHPIKKIENLLHGLRESKYFEIEDYKLVIAGVCEARHKDYLESLHRITEELDLVENVFFIGQVSGANKEKLYAESFVLVLPSETENFGNVVIESLNQGTPVIASRGTPWSDLLDYKCGDYIDNDKESIGAAIDRLITMDSSEYLNFRQNAKKLVDNKFDINIGIRKWIEIYEDFSL